MRQLTPARRLALAALVVTSALALVAPTALAHGNYFDTAYNTERALKWKFPRILASACQPLPTWARAQYGAQSYVRGTTRIWNHFYCGVKIRRGPICLVVVHHVARTRPGITVTSWPRTVAPPTTCPVSDSGPASAGRFRSRSRKRPSRGRPPPPRPGIHSGARG